MTYDVLDTALAVEALAVARDTSSAMAEKLMGGKPPSYDDDVEAFIVWWAKAHGRYARIYARGLSKGFKEA